MKAKEMHYFSNLFDKVFYMFRKVHRPPSGVSQHCIHAIGIGHSEILNVGITSNFTHL
jgi:hypothetical protein